MGCLSHKSVNLPSMICAAFSKNVYYMFRFSRSRPAPSVLARHAHISAMHIGSFLRQVRERAKLTQRELAAKLGTSQSAVAKIEGRDDVLLSTLIAYVKAAGGRYEIEVAFDEMCRSD